MRIIEFSIRRRVTVAMTAVALMLFGIVAYGRLSINLLPDLSYPTLTVESTVPGAAPAEVEALVTRPIEEVVGVVAGVKRLSSVSRPGLSQVTLEFEWGRNMDFAALDVRQKLDLVALPRESSKPVVLRFDPGNDPIQRLYLTASEASNNDLSRLRYIGEELLKKDLESAEGVAAIKVNGGYEEEIQVKVDEGKLALLGLTIQEVNNRLSRENVNQAGGSLYESEARYLVRANNEFENLQDILDTNLMSHDGRNVRLADVASVVRGQKARDVVTRYAGGEAVELAIYKEGDANTVAVSRSVASRLEHLREELPEGVELSLGLDQSTFIQASIREVLENALVGGGIAILVLLLFLKDPRSTLIIGLSIPISVVATFFLMYRTGTTLNIMSLGGLALGVGMLVDNAIVVLEAIYKKKETGIPAFRAALEGASEVGGAVAASTLTTVAVFLPVVFLEGIAAQLFRDMALTVSFSLIASLAVSLTLIPMLAATLAGIAKGQGDGIQNNRIEDADLPPTSRTKRVFGAIFVTVPGLLVLAIRKLLLGIGFLLTLLAKPIVKLFDFVLGSLSRAYPAVLSTALKARWVVLLVAVLLFGSTLTLLPGLGFDLIPSFSQGEFSFLVELPEGTAIQATDRFLASVQEPLVDDPRIESLTSTSGGRGLSLSSSGAEGENTGRIQVRMASGTTPADETAVADALRERLHRQELATIKFERPTFFSFRTPIEVEVYSDQLEELHLAATAVEGELTGIDGLVDLKSSAEIGNPELEIRFRRDQLARLDLNLGDVSDTLRNKVQGEVATRFTEGDREIDIVVRSVESGEASIDAVRNFIVGQRDGVPIYLKSIADIEVTHGPSEIRRIGQRRAAVISGNLADRDMGAVAGDARSALAGMALPASATAALSGQEEEREVAVRSMMLALALAIFLVYLVMASQFESFLHPFVIIFSLPLGAIGVIGALALTGRSVNLVAMIGTVMLAGIVVNNAIVLIDAVNQKRRQGLDKVQALVKAGQDRLRPILMTSSTTILGLLPMALGLGEGAELRAPLAITVIGGLTVSTALTLIVIPVVYSLFDRRGNEAFARLKDGSDQPGETIARAIEEVSTHGVSSTPGVSS